MDENRLRIEFEGLSPAEANIAVGELEQRLRQLSAGALETQRVRTRDDAQDLGVSLELIIGILGTPVAIEVAKGIRDWVAKRGSRVVIRTAEGTIVATGDAAANIDVAATAEALKRPGA